jgi:threonine-phosphate decarboxylase
MLHGGDLGAVGRRHGVDPAALLDFSANVNPLGPPPGLVDRLSQWIASTPTAVTAYPPQDPLELREALARRHGATPEAVVVANGSAALLDAIVRIVHPRRALLPVPAFAEYARALASADVEIVPFPLYDGERFSLDAEALAAAIERSDAQCCIVCTPHNPSGSICERDDLLRLCDRTARAGRTLIVDEAFVDFSPSHDILPEALAYPHVVVLRSLTKLFAIPGLRIGYALAHPATAVRLRSALPSWPVSAIALEAARLALADESYVRRTIAFIARERASLAARLAPLAECVFPSHANFLLLRMRHDPLLVERMIVRHGIVVRDCERFAIADHATFVRVAVRTRCDNERLVRALAVETAAASTAGEVERK